MSSEIPLTYKELLAKYQELLLENASLRTPSVAPDVEADEAQVNHSTPSLNIAAAIEPERGPAPELELEPQQQAPIKEDHSPVNPFLLEPVLRHLGPLIDYQSLRSARQACKRWNLFLTPAFLQKAKLCALFIKEKDSSATPNSSDSDEEDDVDGWRTIQNFGSIYPYPQQGENKVQDIDKLDSQTLRAYYWEHKSSFYYNSSNLGFEIDPKTKFYIPSPPIPETLELIGQSCPVGWLQTYGYLIKNLQIDFGNFARRERYGDVDPNFLLKLLRDYCPNVEHLKALKPNYKLQLGPPPPPPFPGVAIEQEGGSSEIRTLPIQMTPDSMGSTKFEKITTLEILAYRSDRVQCVKEILASTPNLKHLTLSMFSVSPEVESQFLETANAAGYLTNLTSLKFPMGIKATTLVFLASLDFSALKVLQLGRVRQTRWLRDQPQLMQALGPIGAFVDPTCLTDFLQNISSTLEHLSLTMNLTHPDEIWLPLTSAEIPMMPYLKVLEYRHVRPEFTESFNFCENLPSLESIELSADANNDELIARKLLPENLAIASADSVTKIKFNNFLADFPSVVRMIRCFPQLKILHVLLPLAASDAGNANVRRPFSRYLFKLRKLNCLEELKIKCAVAERDDFSYSIGFCLRYMRALKVFGFHSTKTVPRLTPFAVEMGIAKAPSLLSLELEDFIIYKEDQAAIESALKKKVLRTKFTNCFIVDPFASPKGADEPSPRAALRSRQPFEPEKWNYEIQKYTDFESLAPQPTEDERVVVSSISFESDDTESIEFAIASL